MEKQGKGNSCESYVESVTAAQHINGEFCLVKIKHLTEWDGSCHCINLTTKPGPAVIFVHGAG